MGYYSRVAIECDKATYDKVMAYIRSLPEYVYGGNGCYRVPHMNMMPDRYGLMEYSSSGERPDRYGLYWSYIKWYSDYSEMIMSIITDGKCYHILSVGEDAEIGYDEYGENFLDTYRWGSFTPDTHISYEGEEEL